MKDWFEWARKQRIVIAMSGGVVYTVEGGSNAIALFDEAVNGAGVRVIALNYWHISVLAPTKSAMLSLQ
ncbi:hypothetical protein JYQ62_29940 [Nostoc sp. UHCC 0702]|nr:hypothetical protein JYQ62_29940 [Nostoc sp. UHCC 0702]